MLDASIICEKHAHNLQETLNGLASTHPNSSMFADILGGPGDEGPDDPNDVAIGELYEYQADMQGPITEPLTTLPDIDDMPTADTGPVTQPLTPLLGDNAGFLKALGILGIAAGGAVALIAGAVVITNLTATEEDLAQRLYADYGSSGLSLDDIRSLIGDNPNLTEAQWRKLLSQYGKVIAANPNLVNKYGALEVFQTFIALASYDAAHGGNYTSRTPTQGSLTGGIEEAEAILGALETGQLSWPVMPDPSGDAEIIDANGQAWDVKAFRSGNFDLKKAALKIQIELHAKENVILDTRWLSPKDAWTLYQEILRRGWGKNVIWWPTMPTSP